MKIGTLDATLLLGYLVATVLFGLWMGRKQRDLADYAVGGRDVPWWVVLFSIVATETSTVTFLSIPGVAFGGDMTWLQLPIGYLIGRLLVVSFNGSLSPQIRTAVNMLRSGEVGNILNIHATVWQGWKTATTGKWRQVPEIAGGGFMFDTGAHLLNTVSDLVGEDFVEVAAWLDNRGAPVDILGTVMARTRSGILVTLSGCGDAIKSCHSDVRIFCEKAILRTGVWGEMLEIWRDGEEGLSPVPTPPSLGQWEQFLKVRRGEIDNPCPPEVGMRMARFWDAIKASAAQGGQMVKCG